MISLPSAATKAIFDMGWDVIKAGKSDETPRPERSRGFEDGIEMHHVNTEGSPTKDETSLTRRSRRVESDSASSQPDETSSVSDTRPPSPEILSLPTYLKERFNETKMQPMLDAFVTKFPTFSATTRRLPYALLPFRLLSIYSGGSTLVHRLDQRILQLASNRRWLLNPSNNFRSGCSNCHSL